MTKIKQRLIELEPYVLSIRFTKGLTVIDTLFKDGWVVPKSKTIGAETNDKPNYYMIHPLDINDDSVGLDEMLDYIGNIITVNVERELKLELLQQRINDLREIFSVSDLQTCKRLEFKIPDIGTNKITLYDIPILTNENDAINDGVNEGVNEGVNSKLDITNNINTIKVKNQMVDLPPKKGEKIEVVSFDAPKIVCKCGPNDVCPVCESQKF